MKIQNQLSDGVILEEIGQRFAAQRLRLGLTQETLAIRAGVSKSTVERTEAGRSSQMESIIKIMRVLDLLDSLDRLLPETELRPMDLLKLKGKGRKRAATPRKPGSTIENTWRWGDES